MNKFLMLSVSVVLVLLVAFANEEARAQTDAQFLNSLAADTRKTLPTTIGDVEFTDATTYCPAGCQRNYATSLLGLTGWTPRLTKQNVAIGQLEQSVKPQMLKDYCTSPAKQRNIGAAVYVYDMYKAYIGVFSVTPSDCPASATPNVAPNTSGTSVEDQYWDAVKNSSRVGDFQAYLNHYPYGQYASIARLRINQFGGSVSSGSSSTPVSPGNTNPSGSAASTVEQQYWDAVKNSTRPSDFQDYLNNYPNGQYAPIARLRINQLSGSVSSVSAPTTVLPGGTSTSPVTSATSTVEQQYWDAVKNSSRVDDFQNYLKDYPNGQFVPIARLKISQLGGNAPMNPPNSTAEDQYWNNISNSQRAQDFQGYLYNYPNGTYASLARLRISQLGGNTTQSSPVVSAVEEQYWNNVKNSQRPQDFQDYLNTYPSGQYALIARLRINQLSVSTPSIATASLAIQVGGPQPVARTVFLILDDDPITIVTNAGIQGKKPGLAPRMGILESFLYKEMGNRWNDGERALAVLKKHVIAGGTTDFNGTLLLTGLPANKRIYLFGIAQTRGRWAVWDLWYEIPAGQGQVSGVLDQNNAAIVY
jgi:hypothetical protein